MSGSSTILPKEWFQAKVHVYRHEDDWGQDGTLLDADATGILILSLSGLTTFLPWANVQCIEGKS